MIMGGWTEYALWGKSEAPFDPDPRLMHPIDSALPSTHHVVVLTVKGEEIS